MVDVPHFLSQPSYDELVLERIRVAAHQAISSQYLRDEAVLTAHADYFGESLAFRLESEVLGKTVGQKTVTRTVYWDEPKNWWHGVLDRFFPLAAKTVRKSRTVEVTVNYKAVFPDAQVRFPKELGHPRIVAMPDVSSWRDF